MVPQSTRSRLQVFTFWMEETEVARVTGVVPAPTSPHTLRIVPSPGSLRNYGEGSAPGDCKGLWPAATKTRSSQNGREREVQPGDTVPLATGGIPAGPEGP